MKHLEKIKFDSIELVKLKKDYSNIEEIMNNPKEKILSNYRCTVEESERVIELWDSFVPAEQSRCHSPVFALYLLKNEQVVTVISICWSCNNIYFFSKKGSPELVTFDAETKKAKVLLNLCKNLITN